MAAAGAGQVPARRDAPTRAFMPGMRVSDAVGLQEDLPAMRREAGDGAAAAPSEPHAGLRRGSARGVGRSGGRGFGANYLARCAGAYWRAAQGEMKRGYTADSIRFAPAILVPR